MAVKSPGTLSQSDDNRGTLLTLITLQDLSNLDRSDESNDEENDNLTIASNRKASDVLSRDTASKEAQPTMHYRECVIESNEIRHVIGRGGLHLKRLQREYKTRIVYEKHVCDRHPHLSTSIMT